MIIAYLILSIIWFIYWLISLSMGCAVTDCSVTWYVIPFVPLLLLPVVIWVHRKQAGGKELPTVNEIHQKSKIGTFILWFVIAAFILMVIFSMMPGLVYFIPNLLGSLNQP